MVNVVKSLEVPESLAIEKLKLSGSYRKADVVEQICKDFNNKCYLCEEKEITTINVEHFKPHRNKNVDLKFDWTNLFYCCAHCNNVKGDKVEFDNILNCTLAESDVLNKIKLKIEAMPFGEIQIAALDDDEATKNTVLLLNRIYNGETPLKLLEGVNLRKRIIREVNEFIGLLFDFDDETNTPEEKEDYRNKLRRKLSEKSPFTAFKVWTIRDKPELLAELGGFIPTVEKIYN